jgi:DNA repair protein RecN (Recombination protein N)
VYGRIIVETLLKKLHIQNYALFDSVEVDFPPNLAIITGETGAGKSILLGALSLLLGERAEVELVNDKAKKCIVEGEFKSASSEVKNFFQQNDLDYHPEIIIRREVSPTGKSRAFINDTPVNLTQLKSLTSRLIDIHSQNENLLLNENEFQFYVLDAYAAHAKLIAEYKQKFYKYKKINAELEELLNKENEARKEKDYLEFQMKEMLDAALIEGEDKKIEEELELLKHAEQIKANLSFSEQSLTSGEKNVTGFLNEIRAKINAIASINPALGELRTRLDNAIIDIKDIAAEIESLEQKINYDPNRVNLLTERLETIYHLAHKHRVNTVGELLKVQDEINNRLTGISSLEEEITRLSNEKISLESGLKSMAVKISSGREKVVPPLQKEIQKNLLELGMPNAQFIIDKQTTDTLGIFGMDTVKFLFSANKGKELREVEKVASGGELSRLMLVIKALIATSSELPAIVFDEIDAGVSGKVAGQVADLVLRISKSMQVIMITHLPQIASRGDAHYLVYKEDVHNKTVTRIKKLSPEERVEEIARMISSGKPGSSALKTAAELLEGK